MWMDLVACDEAGPGLQGITVTAALGSWGCCPSCWPGLSTLQLLRVPGPGSIPGWPNPSVPVLLLQRLLGNNPRLGFHNRKMLCFLPRCPRWKIPMWSRLMRVHDSPWVSQICTTPP